MKKLLFIICIFIAGCIDEKEPIQTEKNGKNSMYSIDLIFEKDSVKVYRFWDMGEVHYFTTYGETISTKTRHVGKTLVKYDENIK